MQGLRFNKIRYSNRPASTVTVVESRWSSWNVWSCTSLIFQRSEAVPICWRMKQFCYLLEARNQLSKSTVSLLCPTSVLYYKISYMDYMGCSSKYVPLCLLIRSFFFPSSGSFSSKQDYFCTIFFSISIKTILRSRKKFDFFFFFWLSEITINISW